MTTRVPTRSGWWVTTAEARGAHHVARDMPYEDACAVGPAGGRETDQTELVVAVADGHGHSRHFRSAKGAELAVTIATEMGTHATAELAGIGDARRADEFMRQHFGPELVTAWRDAVRGDLARSPVTDQEFKASGLEPGAPFDELVYGYGATLLVAIAAGRWLLCLQLGDGDLFVVAPNGAVSKPMPIDPRLDGLRTTSLCQPDAADSIRYAVIDAAQRGIAAVMLATDGYGNAQVRNDWEVAFGADLAALTAEHGARWIGEQLPTWVRRCASSGGSGDDVTAALMFAAGAIWQTPPSLASAVAEVTLPDVPRDSPAKARASATASAAAPTVPLATVPLATVPAATVPFGAGAAASAGTVRVPATAPTAIDTDRTVILTPSQSGRSAHQPSPRRTAAPPADRPAADAPRPPQAASPRRSRRVMALAATTVVAVAILVTLVILVLTRSKSPAPVTPQPQVSVSASVSPSAPATLPAGPGQVGSGPSPGSGSGSGAGSGATAGSGSGSRAEPPGAGAPGGVLPSSSPALGG